MLRFCADLTPNSLLMIIGAIQKLHIEIKNAVLTTLKHYAISVSIIRVYVLSTSIK